MSAPDSADLELKIERPGDRYVLTLRLRPGDHVSTAFPTNLDLNALLQHALDPETYGHTLHDALFADPAAREAFLQYRAAGLAAGGLLRVRLFLPDELQRLRWELLPDPESGRPLALGAPLLLSRYLGSDDVQPLQLRPRGKLRALIAVAAPADARDYGLATIDAEEEATRVRAALGADFPHLVLGAGDRPLSWDALGDALREGYDVLYLVAHGQLNRSQPWLFLTDDQGNTDRRRGGALADLLRSLGERRPRLVVLASCESVGDGEAETLAALGPLLARAGVPAVLGMQGQLSLATSARFAPVLFRELFSEGVVDRAIGAARLQVADAPDWWLPVIYTRLEDGRLWEEEPEQLLPGPLVNIEAGQTGDVKTGDIAGGDITRTTIHVWGWDRVGQDLLNQLDLAQLLGIQASEQAQATRQQWARMDWSQAAESYRREMLRLYGSMQIFGMPRPVPLDNVFTDVYLLDKPSAWRRHSIEALKEHTELHAAGTPYKRIAGGDLIARERRLFILGQPGAGKTTFLKHLVSETVRGRIEAIPIFVSLKAWGDSSLDLMPFLVRQFAICAFPEAQPFIETILSDGAALVLFDGLDEVGAEGNRHQRITQAIRDFAQQYSNSQVVITCRTAATEYTFEQFSYCELADFTQEQIETFVGRWFQGNEAKRAKFLEAFARPEHKRLRELARRPLLLTMLCLTFEETLAFPQNRAELYEEAIDALLKKWDSSRNIQRDQIYRKFSLGQKRQLLSELAAETFERGEIFIPRRDLADRVVRFLRRLPPADQGEEIDGEAVLRAIEAQHGLLVERAQGIYSFSHLTFQEYFTARYIAEHPGEPVLRGAVAQGANPQWREVLLLTASMLNHANAKLCFRLWTGHLQGLLQPDPTVTALLAWVGAQARAAGSPGGGLSAAVLTITLIDQAALLNKQLIADLTLACDIERDIDRAFDRDIEPNLDRARARARAHALDLDRARIEPTLDSVRDIGHAFDRDIETTLARARARALDLDRARARAHVRDIERVIALTAYIERARDLTAYIERARDLARDIDLARDLAQTSMRIRRQWARNEHHAATASLEHVPEQDWQLTSAQLDTLEGYLEGTLRLLECLELASVEDRQAVLDRLLVPPDSGAAS